MRQVLGIERTVVMAPTAYGKDNSLMLDAMKKIGPSARGVVTIDGTTTDAEFERLSRLGVRGVRGVRFFMLPGGVLGWDIIERMAKRLHEFHWHIVFQTDGRTYPDHEAVLNRLACTVVIDHVGKFLDRGIFSVVAAHEHVEAYRGAAFLGTGEGKRQGEDHPHDQPADDQGE